MGARVACRVCEGLLRNRDAQLRRQRVTDAHLAQRAKTTVLRAAFNEERFIARAIESVFHQTEQAFRLLIVDDGSSDRTFEIARSYLKDSRVRLVRQRHRGPSAALQKGLRSVDRPFFCSGWTETTNFFRRSSQRSKKQSRVPRRGLVFATRITFGSMRPLADKKFVAVIF
jgi:Glycosyl transferase family 2